MATGKAKAVVLQAEAKAAAIEMVSRALGATDGGTAYTDTVATPVFHVPACVVICNRHVTLV